MSKPIEATAKAITATKYEKRAIDHRRNKMLMTEPDMEKRKANLAKYRKKEEQLRADAHGAAGEWWKNGDYGGRF